MLTGALKSLFAVAEAYPDLKANQNFLNLQEELTSTEDRIAYSRQFYNDSVLTLQQRDPVVPANILAGMFNFEKREFFEAEPEDTGAGAGPVLARRAPDPPMTASDPPLRQVTRVRADRAQQAPHVPDPVRLRRRSSRSSASRSTSCSAAGSIGS